MATIKEKFGKINGVVSSAGVREPNSWFQTHLS